MQQKVDVIVTYGGAVALVKGATTSIPIVFVIAADALFGHRDKSRASGR